MNLVFLLSICLLEITVRKTTALVVPYGLSLGSQGIFIASGFEAGSGVEYLDLALISNGLKDSSNFLNLSCKERLLQDTIVFMNLEKHPGSSERTHFLDQIPSTCTDWKARTFIVLRLNVEDRDTQILKNDSQQTSSLLIELSKFRLDINSGFFLLRNRIDFLGTYSRSLFELYSIKSSMVLQSARSTDVADIWGLDFFYTLITRERRRYNFNGTEISGVSMVNKISSDKNTHPLRNEKYLQDAKEYTLATRFDVSSSETKFAGGFEVEFYRYLRDALNFTEKAVNGSGFVREGPNGSLTGMALQVKSGEADLAISSTEFLEYRAYGPDGVSYLLPSFKSGMLAYFKQPPASSIRDVFFSAFSPRLWIIFFGVWLGISGSLCLALASRLQRMGGFGPGDSVLKDEFGIWAAGAVCQQGWHSTPDFISTRAIFFTGWLTSYICFIAFSAQLVAILSVEVVPISSFRDLLRDDFFLYSDSHIPTTKYYVKGMESRGLIRTLPEGQRNVEIDDVFAKVLASKSAIVSIDDSIYPVLDQMGYSVDQLCSKLSTVKVDTRPVIMANFVKRGSEFRGIFNAKILQMIERGVSHRILSQYMKKTSVRCLTRDSSAGYHAPLTLRDLFTAYSVLLAGATASFLASTLEQLLKKFKDKFRSVLNLRVKEVFKSET